MTAVLINPNLVVQRNDPFTTGIVYMPIGLAYLAASLIKHDVPVQVIDAFAQCPLQARHEGDFSLFGLTYNAVLNQLPPDVKVIFIYAINLTNHQSTIGIISTLHHRYPDAPIVVVENTQAVTAYAIRLVAEEFYKAGADYILTGEAENRGVRLYQALIMGGKQNELIQIDGIGGHEFYTEPQSMIDDLDDLPYPAWHLFPLNNYWRLRFAHGPQSASRYLPILSSRGCPYPCSFCVVPATNKQKWRPRSAKNVVNEMEDAIQRYHVREFHIEDLDPTISDQRIRDISTEIIQRKLNITWKIVAGTKVETIRNEDTIDLMAKSGCRYISISPETGSPRVLKMMRKPFDLQHAIRLVKRMSSVGIKSQACFVLGYPGETDADRQMTWDLVRDLTRQGVDEIALFIAVPVPGSAIYGDLSGYTSLSQLNFSPEWREDYAALNAFRLNLYRHFLIWKMRYHPFKLLYQPINFLRRHFETKMEMVPYRAAVLKWRAFRASNTPS